VTGYHIVGILVGLAVAAFVVWMVDRTVQREAQRAIRTAEAQTWGDPSCVLCRRRLPIEVLEDIDGTHKWCRDLTECIAYRQTGVQR
jgi:hypothetical protein